MVGAIRKERMKASRPYERKVHFQQETSDIPITATPVRQAAPVLIPGAEDHKLQKRKGVSAARRRSGGLKSSLLPGEETDNIFAYATDPYPKTPVKKSRARARHPLATDMSIDKITASSKLQDFPSSPFGKSMGKPDVSDFSDIPRIAFLDTALPSSIEDIGSELEEMRSKIIEKGNGCRCAELEHENGELRRKYDALYNKHQTLLAILKEMRANMGLGGSLHAIEPQDEMLCDADDEFEQSQSSMLSGYLRRSTFTPAPALASASSTPSTSSSSSSIAAEFGTPSETPAMPLRVIDEDYDEGYDRRSLRIEEVRSDVSRKLGLTEGMSMEETLDRLTDALSVKWRITDNSNIVIPPLTMPPLPDFQM